MASPAVSNLGEIEWTYTLSFRVTCCRNGDELLIVRSVAPHSPSPVRTLTSQRPQICCACRTCTWTDQGCSDGMPRISTRCSSRAGQAEKRCYDRPWLRTSLHTIHSSKKILRHDVHWCNLAWIAMEAIVISLGGVEDLDQSCYTSRMRLYQSHLSGVYIYPFRAKGFNDSVSS